MAGPKTRVNDKDMQAVTVSTDKYDQKQEEEALEAKKKEFLGGDEDDLKQLGFYDSDDEIDFTNFKVGRKNKHDDEEEEAAPSLFGRLTSAF